MRSAFEILELNETIPIVYTKVTLRWYLIQKRTLQESLIDSWKE